MVQSLETKIAIQPNLRQQEAIETLKGQVMLLAGPGTGKTFTVIRRIEKMLKDGIKPQSILCLTFSDAAATEMRQRLIKQMGAIATQVDIYTYHSFCNDIIRQYPNQFNLASGVELITDTKKIELMKETIDEVQPRVFIPPREHKYGFVNDFINHSQHLKSLRITKEEYLSNIETNPTLMPRIKELENEIYINESNGMMRNKGRYEKIEKIKDNIERAKELWEIHDKYCDKMIEHNLIDFSDMICFVLNAFEEDENFRHEVSNRYSYFLVDEYQDTNELQNEIIFNLTDANKEQYIFVVGDDDQIIYTFQGAKNDNIENFLNKYPQTKVICLEENNRSTQTILDFSYNIVNQDTLRLENNKNFSKKYNISKKLIAKNPKVTAKDRKIKRIQFGDILQEYNYIVDDIKKIINSNECPEELSEIAVICKKRAELQTFAELLKGKNIPCQIDEGKDIFNIRSSTYIYFYMKAICNHLLSKDKFYSLFLTEPFAIELEDYNKALTLIDETKNDFIEVFRTNNEWKCPEKINRFLHIYDGITEYSKANTLRNTVVELINRSGILEYFYKNPQNRIENLEGIKKIIDEATDYEKAGESKTLEEFVQYLDDCKNDEIVIKTEKVGKQNAVQLTTYHGSKGREFEYVYLPNLVAKNWENFKINNEYKYITDVVLEKEVAELKKDSELRKLLFVGITRAKYSLMLSFADVADGKAQEMTKYLSDLDNNCLDIKQFECKEDEFLKELYRSISTEARDNQKFFKDYIQNKANKVELSPSRLNDYLSCPRKFFYLKILGIDVEESNWDAANFGTIIHNLLENSAKYAMNNGEYPDMNKIKTEFENEILSPLNRFSKPEIREKYERLGNEAIDKFYPYFSAIPASRLEALEFEFNGLNIGENAINGKIDRIEVNSDGTIDLYDYKTGKAKPEKQISIGGNNENYFNQLCFYKYAYEKLTGKKVANTGLIFVEDNKTVSKELTNEDMEYIENLINETYTKIKNLQFNPTNDKNSCRYCQYKDMCKLDLI
ncbi:ATP-dependent helicase [bacterium]|nr:ATP-dependent helicase [bacterium]